MKKKFLYLLLIISVFTLFGCKFMEEDNHTEHTYEYISYEETHFKQYTCGCPSPEIVEAHYDFNEDENCDACNYIMNLDVNKYVSTFKELGFTVGNTYITEEELVYANKLMNTEIKFMGGNFTVEIKNYISLCQDGDYSKSVQFNTFATEEQATLYAELYVSSRLGDSVWKVAKSGCVVILTSLDIATEVIHLEFK